MKARDCWISIFVVIWLLVFHYESLRVYYLNPLFKQELPKVKFLFPPAGWIMFYRVSPAASNIEIYGLDANRNPQLIDPHDILQTRPIGYDNIRRGALFSFADPANQRQACAFLYRKLKYFQGFVVVHVQYPDVSKERFFQQRYILYQCQ